VFSILQKGDGTLHVQHMAPLVTLDESVFSLYCVAVSHAAVLLCLQTALHDVFPGAACVLTYLLTYLLTYSLTPWCRILFEKLSLNLSKYPDFFMEPEGSSPCSQNPATGPYPEPAESIRPIKPYLPKVHVLLPLLRPCQTNQSRSEAL
jgi:hypothetical protein